MKIQYVSRYIALSEEGLVPRLQCPMDQGLLLCNQDNSDMLYLYCLSCEYKNFMGSQFYDQIVTSVKKVESI
jgi:hypothetical protein